MKELKMSHTLLESSRPVEILLVEDNEADVVLAKRAFKKGKIANNVNVALDGIQALEVLRKQGEYANAATPDIILMDINLPKVSGLEVLEKIRADDTLKRIPVVMLTSSMADVDVDKSYDLAANSYIVKPIDAEKFKNIVTAIEDFWFSVVVLPKNGEKA